MIQRPAVWRPDVARSFQQQGVVSAYRYRPPYPAAVFDRLVDLITEPHGTALDLGCGTGFITRPLAARGIRVDAVDVSGVMIEEGKRLPGGDDPGITWMVGRAEDAPLRPPYALVTAGDSLHWMEWEIVLPRMAEALTADGVMAVLSVGTVRPSGPLPWARELGELLRQYSTVKEWSEVNLMAELERSGLFRTFGRVTTDPEPFEQSLEEYVESWHGRATLARERMGATTAAFDDAVRRMVRERNGDTLQWGVVGHVTWGRPVRH